MRPVDAPLDSSLYVHVPFCARKCEYCAFYSHPANGEQVNRYVSALVREMDSVAFPKPPSTIFFGGGTPTFLNLNQWQRVLEAMACRGMTGAPEWTVECNPATVSLDKARLLRDFGVNRISMGVQSLHDDLLDRLGRIHSRDAVFRSFDTLRAAGFDNINLDLMFAIPGQSLEIWRQTLAEAMALQSEHLSCYEVIYEEDTPLYRQLQAGQCSIDENLASEMYQVLQEAAARHGFRQYEVANFARQSTNHLRELPDRACRHNVNYWRGGDCLGLGPSATGTLRGVRTKNISNTELYCARVERGEPAAEWEEELSPLARAGEVAAFGLRMNAGWPFELFLRRTGYDLRTEWTREMTRLVRLGYGERTADRFRLTNRGLRYADWAAELFLRPDNGPQPSLIAAQPGKLHHASH